jgi:hypothetical protein
LSPSTVTELPPLIALFSCTFDSTAASKLYPNICVPAPLPTVKEITFPFVKASPVAHDTSVGDAHVVVKHMPSDTATVAVRSDLPKLKPKTVSELPPLRAPFISKYDSAGASKLYPSICVPS